MKHIIILIMISISLQSHARLNGINEMTSKEKKQNGFKIELLSHEANSKYYKNVETFKFEYGRNSSDFKLIAESQVSLPIPNSIGREFASIKTKFSGIVLNSELSAMIYSDLRKDYTPKKLKEGLELADSKVSCESEFRCIFESIYPNFYIFGHSHFFFGTPKNYVSPNLQDYKNKSKTINFNQEIFNSLGEFNEDFILEVEKMAFEYLPSKFIYQDTKNSTPDRDLSYEQHLKESNLKLEESFGENVIERQILKSLLRDSEKQSEELFKNSGSSNCTYSCGASGPFVRTSLTSTILF